MKGEGYSGGGDEGSLRAETARMTYMVSTLPNQKSDRKEPIRNPIERNQSEMRYNRTNKT